MIVVTGGGGGINLKVVGGTTQPTSPKENTIWVNTATAINGYAFSATQPHRVSKNKNLIVYPYFHTTQTLEGVTWTDNGDGTLKANGTASASSNSNFRCSHIGVDKHEMLLSPGTYHLSGCPAGGSSAKYVLEMAYSYDDWATTTWARDYGSGATFTLTAEAKARLVCTVIKATTVSNIVFKPQLEKGSTATSFAKGDATGMVWFSTGTSSNAAVNVDKKNTVMLYPKGCRQYVSGAWATKTATVYQNGTGVELWTGMLFDNGDEYTAITGGFSAVGEYQSDTGNSGGYLALHAGYGATGAYLTNEPIDLTDFSTLAAIAKCTGSNTKALGIAKERGTNFTALTYITATNDTAITLDISGYTGAYYVGILSNSNNWAYAKQIKLEV